MKNILLFHRERRRKPPSSHPYSSQRKVAVAILQRSDAEFNVLLCCRY
jgi:hypothetical protein